MTRPPALPIRRAQLEAERDELLARLDGCADDQCPHHDADLADLDTVLWLLDGCT